MRLELKRPWSDGTTYLLFEPVESLEKLAALTPRPEINLVLYHGVLATRTLAARGRRLPRHGEEPGERFPRGGWRSAQG